MTRSRRGAALLAAAALAVTLAACGTQTAPRPVRRADLTELTAAVVTRFRIDLTTQGRATVRVNRARVGSNGRGLSVVFAEFGSRVYADGVASTVVATTQQSGQAPVVSRALVGPRGAFVSPPVPAPPGARPWIRLSADLSDAFSRRYASSVALAQRTGQRLFCFTELGDATLLGAEETLFAGLPTLRYRLRVDLTRGAADEDSARGYRDLGLRELDVGMYVDAVDRVRRCEVDQPLPADTGRVTAEQTFFAFGASYDITAPPPDQIAAPPPG